jgi:broad specificity phosphatase PhoE
MPVHDDRMIVRTIRHAPVDFSKQKIIAGTLDPSLNNEGRGMIRALQASVSVPEFDVLVTSPLRRARETARQLTGIADADITVTPLCAERNYGQLEGVSPDRLGDIQPKTFYVSVGGIDYSLNPPDGETLEELRARAVAFHEFIETFQGQSILVVSHEAFLQQYHGLLHGLDVYHALTSHVTYLEINEFRLTGNNLVSHELIHKPEIIYENW